MSLMVVLVSSQRNHNGYGDRIILIQFSIARPTNEYALVYETVHPSKY